MNRLIKLIIYGNKLPTDSIITVEQAPVSIKKHLQALVCKAIPLSFLFGADIGTSFIKTYLMANVGRDELEALIIATNISYLVIYTLPEFVGQDIVFISECFGKTRHVTSQHQDKVADDGSIDTNNNMIGALLRQGWILSAIVSIPASAILISSPYLLLQLFNQSSRVNQLAMEFNYPVAFSLSAEFINKISEGFLSAVDKEKWILPYRASSMVVEIGLCFLLIPRYAVAGAGYASLGKSLFGLAYLMCFFRMHSDFNQKFNIFHNDLTDVTYLSKIFNQSWPRFVTKMAGSFSTVGVTMFIGHLPPGRIILDGVVGNYYGLLFALSFGISEAANRIVAQYFGAKDYRDMRRAGNISLILNACIWGLSTILYNSIPLVLASKFLDKEEVHEFSDLLRWYFFLIGLANCLSVLTDNSSRILAAVQDTFLASVGSLLSTVAVTLPLTAIAVYKTNFDLYGVGGANALGSAAAALLTLGYWSTHSNAIAVSNNERISSSNTKAELKFQSFFFKQRQHPPLLYDRFTYRLVGLPSTHESSSDEDHDGYPQLEPYK